MDDNVKLKSFVCLSCSKSSGRIRKTTDQASCARVSKETHVNLFKWAGMNKEVSILYCGFGS